VFGFVPAYDIGLGWGGGGDQVPFGFVPAYDTGLG
jgi:hypothetical protein